MLEAWAGMRAARRARHRARRSCGASPPRAAAAASAAARCRPRRRASRSRPPSFVLVVLAIACWAAPLAPTLGARRGRSTALIVALPLTLGAAVGPAQPLPRPPEGPRAAAAARPCDARCSPPSRWSRVPRAALMGLSGTVAGAADADLDGRHDPDPPALVARPTRRAVVARHRRDARRAVRRSPSLARHRGGDDASAVALALRVRASTLAGHPPGRCGRAVAAAMIGAGLGVAAGRRPQRRLDRRRGAGARPAAVDRGELLGRLSPVALPAGDPAGAVGRARSSTPDHARPRLAGAAGPARRRRAGSSLPPPRCRCCSS